MNIFEIYARYQNMRSFTDAEAWALFRFAAFGEAIGWTLLIIGILCERLPVSWNQYPVHMAGSLHGMLFIIYIGAVLALSPSLRWSGPRIILAGICSVPPYGSLAYELWSAHLRSNQDFARLHASVVYEQLITSSAA